jgi:hypothetical protein
VSFCICRISFNSSKHNFPKRSGFRIAVVVTGNPEAIPNWAVHEEQREVGAFDGGVHVGIGKDDVG